VYFQGAEEGERWNNNLDSKKIEALGRRRGYQRGRHFSKIGLECPAQGKSWWGGRQNGLVESPGGKSGAGLELVTTVGLSMWVKALEKGMFGILRGRGNPV